MFNGGPGNEWQFGLVISLKGTHADAAQNNNYKIRRQSTWTFTYNIGLLVNVENKIRLSPY